MKKQRLNGFYENTLALARHLEETLKMEWKRSFVGARVNRIKSEARSERVALIWDPSSDGGVARYFPLNDDRIFSLTRCVSDACEL